MQRSVTRIWRKADQELSFSFWFSDLLKTYRQERYFRKGSKLYSAGVLGIRKWILAQDLPDNGQALRNILLDAMSSANSACPGSDVWIPSAIAEGLSVQAWRYGSSSEYVDLVSTLSNNEQAIEIFKTLIELSGPLTKITARLGDYNEPFVRYKSSFSFPIKPCQMFVNTLGKATGMELNHPEVFMIEGAPATLAEIEPLIYRSVESSRPIVIVARHYPEEVSATLGTNFKNGKLKILPLVYGSDVSTVNMASDLMAVCKGELVSTHFGDLISASCGQDEKYGSINRIEVTSRGVEIDSDADTSRQVQYLLSKMAELTEDEEPVKELIGNRIHSLTNDSIVVHIPKSSPELHEEVDAMLKHYSAFSQSGMTKTQHGWLPSIYVRTCNSIAESTNYELSRIGGYLLEAKGLK
jgi:hypothetical protein